MNHRESHARCRHRFPKGESRGCPSPPDREHEAVSLSRAPMRQRLSRRSVCLTAGHSIFPSPSLTGWTAISCGCSSAGASRVRLMQAISYRALTAGEHKQKAAYYCIRVAPPEYPRGPERMSKRLQRSCVRRQRGQCSTKKDPTQVAGSNLNQQRRAPAKV